MIKLKKYLKLIAVNLLILFVLLIIANLLAIIVYQSNDALKANKSGFDPRAELPNYKSIDWSEQHFKELSEVRAEYQSYIGWRMLPYAGKTITVSKEGLRITPQHPKVNSNSLEVLFLGGSTTWGVGSDDKNTIPAVFSQKGEGKYKTINYGDHSYRAYQSFLFFNAQVNKGLKPDIVISYDGVNEKAGFVKNHSPISHSRESQIKNLVKGQDRNQSEKEMMSFKQNFFGPLMVLISRFKGKSNPDPSENLIPEKKSDEVAAALLDSWLNSKRLAESNSAKFFCVLQPNAVIRSPNIKHLKINPERTRVYTHLYSSILKLINSAAYYSLKDNFIDLRLALDGEEQYYIDFCHLSPNGNYVITDKLFTEIENRLK